MCKDIDLFGEVIVLKSDVEFWLDNFTRYGGDTPTKRKQQYLKNYPVANSIKAAKLSGVFYVAKAQHDAAANDHQQPNNLIYPTKYAETPPPVVSECPPHFHECANVNCAVYIAREKKAYSRAMYLKRKLARSR